MRLVKACAAALVQPLRQVHTSLQGMIHTVLAAVREDLLRIQQPRQILTDMEADAVVFRAVEHGRGPRLVHPVTESKRGFLHHMYNFRIQQPGLPVFPHQP